MINYWELAKQFPNIENQNAVSEFLLSLKLTNRSETTIRMYRSFLEQFFVMQTESFASLSSETIYQWYCENQGHVKERSLKVRLSILSSFYTFCVQEELIERSLIKSRWFPRLPKSAPKYLGKEEIAKVRQQSEKDSLRSQTILEFMLTSGCRIGEVNRLNYADIDVDNRTATIVGKGKKIRQVHFTEKCAILLERYMITRKESTSPALFLSLGGERLSISQIYRTIRSIGEKAGLKNLHPHQLRHTFATELLAKGAELSFIGEELGHNDIATTQIYARLLKSEIIVRYRKYMG
ncbi:tyrosine-type recombinase/integrase [Peribacillus sp. NPDC097197]|uniref:tyrosine-type recombinase/integrase n=1 Tax=Peribacillus sp. NPDC097197 TaxID=3390615 RepID=UPI003D027C93